MVVVSEERGEVLLAEAGEFLKLGSSRRTGRSLEQRVSPVREKTTMTLAAETVLQSAAKNGIAAHCYHILGTDNLTSGADHNGYGPCQVAGCFG